jgi:hypothetical protein
MDKIIQDGENLSFTQNKNKITYRWNHKWKLDPHMLMFLDYTSGEAPEQIIVTWTYLDKTRNILNNENPESEVKTTIIIPPPRTVGKSQLKFNINLKQGKSDLWKVSFTSKSKKSKSGLYLVFGLDR